MTTVFYFTVCSSSFQNPERSRFINLWSRELKKHKQHEKRKKNPISINFCINLVFFTYTNARNIKFSDSEFPEEIASRQLKKRCRQYKLK